MFAEMLVQARGHGDPDEIAKKMLNSGVQINQIIEFTGLDESEILKIKNFRSGTDSFSVR
jgi:hypothetical protein